MNQAVPVKGTSFVGFPQSVQAISSIGALAPLRFEGKACYDATPEHLFAMVSEARNLHRWLPMLKAVNMDHSHSDQDSQCGVGSIRQCSFRGMGNVDESILWWDPPRSYGFRFEPKGRMKRMTPTTNHVVAFIVENDGRGGSIFTLRVYFNWRGVLMRRMSALMMPMTLNKALANLQRELGGKGGKMRRIA
jgi:uncharacterized protein YndB with AHSA1/START domain